MFSKEEKKNFNSNFWNSFGLYMKKYNKDFGRVRWVNYRSNVKDIYFRLSISQKKAKFSIEIQHKDDGIRALFYEQFKEVKGILSDAIGDDLKWNELTFNEFNNPMSSISAELSNVSIYNKNDWKKTFQFYEKRMVGLHTFWTEFEELFKELES